MAKILLIDDDVVLLKLYSTRLRSDGHEVLTASDGKAGMSELINFKPDLIVLDLLMPELNGFSFLEKVRSDPKLKALKIIVFSSVVLEGQIERLESLGVRVYLNKITTTPTQLVSIVQEQLAL